MKEKYKVVYGVKLYERQCSQCTLTFLVPKSSPQSTCGEYCLDKEKKEKVSGFRKRLKTKRQKYRIQESDYET